jgi:pSer/pThr/pTyr-binding forkhead associated (FHA) protein/tetratricopeptide (TPR) repeat protein
MKPQCVGWVEERNLTNYLSFDPFTDQEAVLKPPAWFIFVEKDDQSPFPLERKEMLIGRSPSQCDLVIKGDLTVSRLQAQVRNEDGRYILKNLGRNVTLVNDKPIKEMGLRDGDRIKMGNTIIKFQVPEIPEQSLPQLPDNIEYDKTLYMPSPASQYKEPQVILTDDSGQIHIFPVNKDEILIGRSSDADIHLDDVTVSRNHLRIEKRENQFFVGNISEGYLLIVNDKQIGKERGTEKRLYAGDRIHVGNYLITFISDRSEDIPPEGEKEIITRMKGAGWAVWVTAVVLVIVFVSYIFFIYGYKPLKIQINLEKIAQKVQKGDHDQARQDIIEFLKDNMSGENKMKALGLLAESTLAMADQMIQDGKWGPAGLFIQNYLKTYGFDESSKPLKNRLDEIRLHLGQQFEYAEQYEMALSEYATIDQESLFFEKAQKGMRRIWLQFQEQRLKDNTVAELLEKAEKNFIAKKYLTPVNDNAYSAYKAILDIEPDNEIALRHIEQMKGFYLHHGDEHLRRGNFNKAITYFERYYIIEPDDADVKRKIDSIRNQQKTKKVAVPEKAVVKPVEKEKAAVPETTSSKKDKIKSMLEESGKDGTWIMKYLFEDQEGEKEEQTPWE